MKNLTIEAVARAVGGQLLFAKNKESVKDIEIEGVVKDNRQVAKNYLFVAMKGERVDGHSFIDNAFERGAACCLTEDYVSDKGCCIKVESTALALKALAAYYRNTLSIPIVGVIGSVGKTSTKEMLYHVLSESFNVLKTEGNYNNEIGLPLTLLSIQEKHQVAVVEMGISDFGEMSRLGAMARPDIVVMTNIGKCHLEFLHDRDGVLKAKSEVFEYMPHDGLLVLNGDDDKLRGADTLGRRKLFYGLSDGCQYRAKDISASDVFKTAAHLVTLEGEADVSIPLPGEHNVLNALAAAAVGAELGMILPEIVRGIEHVSTIAGRNNVIRKGDLTIIDDCYNASPTAMAESLKVLGKAEHRKIAVLGDMKELGSDEVKLHQDLAEHIKTYGISAVYMVGPLMKALSDVLCEKKICEAFHFSNNADLIDALKRDIRENDTLLVKASHSMGFSEVVKALNE